MNTAVEFDPSRIYLATVEAGEDWADKNAAAKLLEESKKSVLAEIMNSKTEHSTMAAKEAAALADPAYKLHLSQMAAARKVANIARVRYDAVKVMGENRRSQESTRRAEMALK